MCSRTWAIFAALLIAACGGAETETVTHERLPNGSLLARNGGVGSWAEADQWDAIPRLRIGSADGTDPNLLFADIWSVQMDELGRLYVLDRQTENVRVFTSEGDYLRSIGAPGEGPGELRNPVGMAWGPEGRLWVINIGNARYEVFDTTGAYVDSFARDDGSFGYPWGGGFDHRGRLIDDSYFSDPVSGEPRSGLLAKQLLTNPMQIDTFHLPSSIGQSWRVDRERGSMTIGVPFTPGLHWAFDGREGVWLGVSDEYRFVHRTLDGDTLLIVERAVARLPVTDSDVDNALSRFERFVPDLRTRVDLELIPDRKPAFAGFVVDGEEYLWVMQTRSVEDVRGGSANTFDIFEPDGTFLGSVSAAIGAYPPPRIVQDQMIGVVLDDLDVPFVVSFDVRR